MTWFQSIQRLGLGALTILAIVLGTAPAGAEDLDALVANLRSPDDATRLAAGRAIVPLLEDQYAALLPRLVILLGDGSERVRLDSAVLVLTGAGLSEANAVLAGSATSALVDRLADPSARVREAAARTLGFVRPHTPSAAQTGLVGLLSDPDPGVRAVAIDSLSRLEATSPAVVSALLGALQSSTSETVRGRSARALGSLGVSSSQVIDGLVAALADPSAFVRQEAISGLAKLGGNARGALEALAAVAGGDSDPLNRRLAVAAVSTIENANGPPICSAAVATPDRFWPPNHELNPVAVSGVSDPDGDAFSIEISGVMQDEGVLEAGSGNSCPDAIIDPQGVRLRAERVGRLNGRVYRISFSALDSSGASCTGEVRVCLPHEDSPTPSCVEDPLIYDSTVCP